MPVRKPVPPAKRARRAPPPAPKLVEVALVPRGHPPHVPDAKSRSQVVAMVLGEIDQKLIAVIVGLKSPKSLRKHYRAELDTAAAVIKSEIVSKAITLARAGDPKMVKFFLETHGWAPTQRIETSGPGGKPAEMRVTVKLVG